MTDPKEVEDYEWPDVAYLNEEVTLEALRNAGDYLPRQRLLDLLLP